MQSVAPISYVLKLMYDAEKKSPPSIIPEKIRILLNAKPFIPFTVHLVDHHSVYIGDASKARLEDDGRALVVQTTEHNETFVETLVTTAIIRLFGKVHDPTPACIRSENDLVSQPD